MGEQRYKDWIQNTIGKETDVSKETVVHDKQVNVDHGHLLLKVCCTKTDVQMQANRLECEGAQAWK